ASALGDLILEDQGLFLWGLGAFLVAHLFYVSAFLRGSQKLAGWRLVPFLLWGALAWASVRPGLGTMAWPVLAYFVAILAMMWRASALFDRSPGSRERALWALTGAVLFGLSDTLLALDRFRGEIPYVHYPIILLYWAGQIGIARSARAFPVA
ncbi:MAG TPA: lysoplasmalogenase, partial [Vicinamibacteria bacterium]